MKKKVRTMYDWKKQTLIFKRKSISPIGQFFCNLQLIQFTFLLITWGKNRVGWFENFGDVGPGQLGPGQLGTVRLEELDLPLAKETGAIITYMWMNECWFCIGNMC